MKVVEHTREIARKLLPRRDELVLRTGRGPTSGNVLDHRFSRFGLLDELPEVCIQHGRRAVDRCEVAITFSGSHQFTTSYSLSESFVGEKGLLTNGILIHKAEMPEADSVLHAPLPVCRLCRLRTSLYSFAVLAGVFAAICTVVAALAFMQAGRSDLARFFAIAFFPGWIPIGMIVLVTLFNRAQPSLRATLATDRRNIVIRAHPRFTAAFTASHVAAPPKSAD